MVEQLRGCGRGRRKRKRNRKREKERKKRSRDPIAKQKRVFVWWKDMPAKGRKEERVAAKPRGWENKTARGNQGKP